ncbi:MAG TPA: hypothetical protein VFY84_07440 [Jiangellales bacterium]|nr:hypothetical protein [Jiangellales bacterium]
MTISVRGCRTARRAAAGLILVAGLAVWAVTATDVGGPGFALTTPHGLWATLLYWTLLISLALAASAPMRQPVVPPDIHGSVSTTVNNSLPIGPNGGA